MKWYNVVIKKILTLYHFLSSTKHIWFMITSVKYTTVFKKVRIINFSNPPFTTTQQPTNIIRKQRQKEKKNKLTWTP